jgi:hypothetical protein
MFGAPAEASTDVGPRAGSRRQLQRALAGMTLAEQEAAVRPGGGWSPFAVQPLVAGATSVAPAGHEGFPVQHQEDASGGGDGASETVDPVRARCLGLLGGDEARLTSVLALPTLGGDLTRLDRVLTHPKSAGRVEAVVALLERAALRDGAHLLTLLRSSKVEDVDVLSQVLSHAQTADSAHLVALVRHATFTNLTDLLAVWSRPSTAPLAALASELGRLGDWPRVVLFVGPRDAYIATKGAAFGVNLQQLQDALTRIGAQGDAAQLRLDVLDAIEREVVDALDDWTPTELRGEIEAAWPRLASHRATWEARITAGVAAARALAQSIADGSTWPGGTGPLPEVQALDRALQVVRAADQADVQSARQGVLTALDTAIQEALTEGRGLFGQLSGGAVLVPDDYNRVTTRLALIHARGAPAQQTQIDNVSRQLSGLEAVRRDGRAQPQTARGGGYAIPEAELAVFADAQGRSLGTFDETLARPEPSDEELKRYISRRDVIQGGLADCFLVAVLSSVADARPRVIYDAITVQGPEAYSVRLYQAAGGAVPGGAAPFTPITIGVDHALPSDGTSARIVETVRQRSLWEWFQGLDPPTVRELWVVLMEKAVAKHQGAGYRTLNRGGNSRAMFELVTGEVAESFVLPASTDSDAAKDAAWARLTTHLQANRPATAGSDAMRIINAVSEDTVRSTYVEMSGSFAADLAGVSGGTSPADLIAAGNVAQMRTAFQNAYNNLPQSNTMRGRIMRALGTSAGVYAWHAYSVLRCTERPNPPPDRRVLLRNPWGQTLGGAAPAGDTGEFEVTFDEFLDRFGSANLGMVNV